MSNNWNWLKYSITRIIRPRFIRQHGLSGIKFRSLEFSYLLQYMQLGLSGLGLSGLHGLSGIKFRSLEAKTIVIYTVYPVFIFQLNLKLIIYLQMSFCTDEFTVSRATTFLFQPTSL